MKKTLFIILALCSMSYGLSGYSLYKTYVAKDTVTHINLDSNFYRGVNWSNKLADTIDRKFIRWYDFNSHDSTLRYFKVDTIRNNPNIDSIAGDVKFSGAPTIAGTLTTHAISGTTGTFSGALSATTLNTGYGNNELHPMDQGVRTTDDVTFDSTTQRIITVNNGDSAGIIVGPNASFGKTLRIGGWNTNDARSRIVTSNGNIHIDNDTSAEAVCINNYFPENVYIGRGGGIVEINKANADSLQFGTGSYLKTYVEGTLPCTLKTSDVTVQRTGVIKYTIIGNTVTLTFPFIYGTSNSTRLRLYCGGLTGALDPGSTISAFSTVVDNADTYSGSVIYTYGLGNYFLFSKYDGSDFTGSCKGIGNWLYTSKVTIQYTK